MKNNREMTWSRVDRVTRRVMLGLSLAFSMIGFGAPAAAEQDVGQWPQWRGPSRDGIVAESPPWPSDLKEQTLQLNWRVELGPSYSGPIVSNDKVFVTESRDKQTEVVQALARTDGRSVWKAEWDGAMSVPFFAWENGDWIRATPAFDSESLYVAGMRDVLVKLDAMTGKEQWRVDFVDRFKSPLPAFGFVSSPLIDGDAVVVQAGASCVKLDRKTGSTVWRALKDDGGMMGSAFSSPVKATLAKREQYLVQTRDKLCGVDRETGAELWSQKIDAFRGMNILTPVPFGDAVFTSSYGGKSWLYAIGPSNEADRLSVREQWTNKTQGYMSTPVVIDGHAYLHLRNQRFTCIDLATGKERWITQPFGKYWSLVAQGRRLLALDERGELLLIEANPEKFELLDQRRITDQPAWAHLAVCGNEVIIRDLKALQVFRWETTSSKKGKTDVSSAR